MSDTPEPVDAALKARFLELTRAGQTRDAALAEIGVPYGKFQKWSGRDAAFKRDLAAARSLVAPTPRPRGTDYTHNQTAVSLASKLKKVPSNKRVRYEAAEERKRRFLALTQAGRRRDDALTEIGVSLWAFRKWCEKDMDFAAKLRVARAEAIDQVDEEESGDRWRLSYPQFATRYFAMPPAEFQALAIDEVERCPMGGIVMIQFHPEAGKTTSFENFAGKKLAYSPEWRAIVASESTDIARKILGRIRKRMEPMGPAPLYVLHFGPFEPQYGEGRKQAQKWGETAFSVYKKAGHDERNYSLEAVGQSTSIVSARCDHLHLDDIQSTKTAGQTPKIMEWFRQDALTRPGESGITSIFGTKVADNDFYEQLEDDPDLDGILKVIRMPAIVTDKITGEEKPLWHERYTLDQLDRIRRKVGKTVWDRAYMMHRSAGAGTWTFTRDDLERCRNYELSMRHPVPEGTICYVTLDPALGSGRCAAGLFELPAKKGRLRIRRLWELTGLQSNRQIIDMVRVAVEHADSTGGVVTDVVIEANNLQKGLINDESLEELRRQYGFAIRPHLTGWNKYDDEIGVASMATSWGRGELETPYADDRDTRFWTDELERQALSWKPNQGTGRKNSGANLRQDLLMVTWFAWLLWRQRGKSDTGTKHTAWKRTGLPYTPTRSGLLVPVGVR